MNQSSRWMFAVFAVCAAAVLGALAIVTSHVLRLERREVESRAAAKADESVRLALWRMDSAVNAIIAKEAARPYFEYQPFYAADRAYTKMFEDVRPGEVLVPSPLLLGTGDYVTLHFQRTSDGTITSPQVPTGNMRDLAESAYVDSSAVIVAEDHLLHLAALMSPAGATGGRTFAGAESFDKRPASEADSPNERDDFDAGRTTQSSTQRAKDRAEPEQAKREYQARSQSAELAASNVLQQRVTPSPRPPGRPAPDSTVASVPPAPADVDAKPMTQADAQINTRTGTLTIRDQSAAEKDDARRAALDTSKDAKPESGESKPLANAPIEESARSPTPTDAPNRGRNRKQVAPTPPLPTTTHAPAPGGPASGAPAAIVPTESPAFKAKLESPAVRLITGSTVDAQLGATTKVGLPPLFALAYEPEPAVALSPFVPAWLGESPRELVFTRTVHTASTTLEQGLWIDWPSLVSFLEGSAEDLVPGASVIPASNTPSSDPAALARRLASIPAELHWTPPAIAATPSWTPARTTLTITWIATLIAIGAIALVLQSSTDLAERRGRFVSAVTHELRTPLTTFCMYSQMLADGMVTSDDARRDYLQTLKQEASRLSRIVENVLDYARLGRRKKSAPPSPIAATDLLARVESALRLRAQQSGLQLLVQSPGPSDASVRADPATVERILYNLVDNACKYAAPPPLPAGAMACESSSTTEGVVLASTPSSIELTLSLSHRHATFSVRDQGPGIPGPERERVFRPFHRGAHHSDGSIPGLGLGLALARGLAHTIGGSLELVGTPIGTRIDLSLPRSDS